MDHIKLAKERDRMCRTHPTYCRGCQLSATAEKYDGDAYDDEDSCRIACMREPEEATAIISKWSEENREPRYPTWREWFLTFSPEVPESFQIEIIGLACVLYKSKNHAYVDYYSSTISECSCDLDAPIPAEVAEMLKAPMITPKGATP